MRRAVALAAFHRPDASSNDDQFQSSGIASAGNGS
jgi:hypothetical protein